jgi:hypothetical protein
MILVMSQRRTWLRGHWTVVTCGSFIACWVEIRSPKGNNGSALPAALGLWVPADDNAPHVARGKCRFWVEDANAHWAQHANAWKVIIRVSVLPPINNLPNEQQASWCHVCAGGDDVRRNKRGTKH